MIIIKKLDPQWKKGLSETKGIKKHIYFRHYFYSNRSHIKT